MVSAWPEPPSAIPAEPSATERNASPRAPGPTGPGAANDTKDWDARDATVTKIWD
jgi:hypothetical protein